APLQRFLGEGRAVGPEKSVPVPGALPEVVKRGHGGGDRVVLIAFALPDDQESPLLLRRAGAQKGSGVLNWRTPDPFFTQALSEGRVCHSQADGYYQDVPKQSHHRLPKPVGDSARAA